MLTLELLPRYVRVFFLGGFVHGIFVFRFVYSAVFEAGNGGKDDSMAVVVEFESAVASEHPGRHGVKHFQHLVARDPDVDESVHEFYHGLGASDEEHQRAQLSRRVDVDAGEAPSWNSGVTDGLKLPRVEYRRL